MLLAGLLLKLGGFGLIRYLLTIFYDVNFIFSPVIYTLALTGAYTAAFMALRQVDLKRVIAYSSIAHMSQGAVAIFSGHEYGISGGFLLLLSHGFVSAGLFAAIGIPYHKMHNRNIFHYGGMRKVMPKWTKYFQFLMFSNIAFPGTFSFVAELCMFVAVASFSSCLLMLMGFTILLNTLYSVSLLVRVTFLQPKGYNKYFSDILVVERVMLFVLSFLTFV